MQLNIKSLQCISSTLADQAGLSLKLTALNYRMILKLKCSIADHNHRYISIYYQFLSRELSLKDKLRTALYD